ncbi:MAG: hypothetical protein K2K31_03625, partial [Clostridia bacterium]|nr:hypothetical protein [Clostridia bacterium]
YYLSDLTKSINVSIERIPQDDHTQIKDISIEEFKDIDKYFSDYVVANGRDINSVWFYNENVNDTENFNESKFNTGRIELVSPNIIAHSQRSLIGVNEVISDEGAVSVVYSYAYTGNGYGSLYNPILINNAENFESLIAGENSQMTGLNEKYYRLISNIDYSEYSDNSKLYKTRFMGYMEGNFMSIKGITLSSGDSLVYGGMFAEIGGANNNSIGTIMNLSISPKVVSFSNARVVGTLSGKIDGGTLVNINILTDSTYTNNDLGRNQNINVSGLNIVGGVAGLALGNYKFQNVYSTVDAVARNQSIVLNEFNSGSSDYTSYSFAGSVFGVLSGDGQTINTIKDTSGTVLGAKAGLMFGLIDSNAKVDKVTLKMFNENIVNAYNYGGLVVGESKGIVSNVKIIGTGEYFKNFSNVPYRANAIGGFAGLISGGMISNLETNQSIAVSTISSSKGFESLGGVAGMISASTMLSNITVKADIIGFINVGGVAGKIESTRNSIMTLSDIDVLANLQVGGLYEDAPEIGVGGLAGFVGTNIGIYMSATSGKENMFEITSAGSEIVPTYGVYVGVYSNPVKVNIGAIIGKDSGSTYTFSNVKSSIIGTVNIIDRGIVNRPMMITLKSVDNQLVNSYASDPILSKLITESVAPSYDSLCYSDIVFTRPNNEISSNEYALYANFYGTVTGTAIDFTHNS